MSISGNEREVPSLAVLEFCLEFWGGVLKREECHLADITLRWNPDTCPDPGVAPFSTLHTGFVFSLEF